MVESKKKGFNLAEALSAVAAPDLGTDADGREQIEYIDIDRIDDDPNNFYELSYLDELAANIELLGLQQPLRVRANPENIDRVIIVSGHRRRAAIRKLVADGRADLREIPCIRERAESSAALQELRLIYANSDTRRLSSAEISKQAERVEALLYQLKEEGYEFPGRMRDHVAEACKVSKSKLSRLKVIRENLHKKWKAPYEKGTLSESTAYALAQMPAVHQIHIFDGLKTRKAEIKWFYEHEAKDYGKALAEAEKANSKLVCKVTGGGCDHLLEKYVHICAASYYNRNACKGCCSKCDKLATCQNACPHLKDCIKKLRADASAQRKQEKLALEERHRPIIMEIQKFWNRFGEARAAAGKSVKAVYKAAGMYYSESDDDKVMKLERLEAKFTTGTTLPYGYSCTLSEVQRFVKVADLLGVSLDYLLCRTDSSTGMGQMEGQMVFNAWMPAPTTPGAVPGNVIAAFDLGDGKTVKKLCYWDGASYLFSKDGGVCDLPPVKWMRVPDDGEEG